MASHGRSVASMMNIFQGGAKCISGARGIKRNKKRVPWRYGEKHMVFSITT